MNREQFIKTTSLVSASLLFNPAIYAGHLYSFKLKAIAFDAFTIFDPRPIFQSLTELVAEDGKHLIELWQYKQFSYQWLRVCGNRYKNFWEVTKDALDSALFQCNILLSDEEKSKVMTHYETIRVWPDVPASLEALKEEDIKLCLLSNMTEKMLLRGLNSSNVKNYFDHVISTDEKDTYKPSEKAYQMGIEKLKLKKEQILFVPFASWDMAGSKWFGYPTFWLNRLNAVSDKLDAVADGVGDDLNDVVAFIKNYNEKLFHSNEE